MEKRILRIPQGHVPPSGWRIAGEVALSIFSFDVIRIARTKALLRPAGTFHGRQFLYEQIAQHALNLRNGYSRRLDLVLLQMHPTTAEEVASLASLPFDAIRALVRLGITSLKDIPRAISPRVSNRDAAFLWMLTSKNIVRRPEDIAWLNFGAPDDFHNSRFIGPERQRAFNLITALVDARVSPQAIAAAVTSPQVNTFRAKNLAATLTELAAVGLNVEEVLVTCGEALWTAQPTRWRYMIDVIGLQTPTEIAEFPSTLTDTHEPSKALVLELLRMGATREDLKACEPVWRAAKPNKVDDTHLTTATRLLTSPPFGIPLNQLSECQKYFEESRDLQSFLNTLATEGYASSDAAKAFQLCYLSNANRELGSLLRLATPRRESAALGDVANWVDVAGRVGHVQRITQLADVLKAKHIPDLHAVTKLAPLSDEFVDWHIHAKKLNTIKKLKTWYRDSVGIIGMTRFGAISTTEIQLLEHAFRAKNYTLVRANQDLINSVRDTVAQERLGAPLSPRASEAEIKAYWRDLEAKAGEVLSEVSSALPKLLEQTGGTLVSSLLRAALSGEDALKRTLAQFGPTVTEITAGRGPTAGSLEGAESEAVALVYGTSKSVVDDMWWEVCKVDTTLPISAAGPYHFQWSAARFLAQKPMDRLGLSCIQTACSFASSFEKHRSHGMAEACVALRPSSMTQAAEPKAIQNQLGVLLWLARRHEHVAGWTDARLKGIAELQDGDATIYSEVMSLQRLFEEDLPEGLRAHAPSCIREVAAADAETLAKRLGFGGVSTAGVNGHDLLALAVKAATKVVLPIFARWAAGEKAKFALVEASAGALQATAVVTKHPSAFFARSGVGLCTSKDVGMWREPRHMHLIAFDMVAQRMVAMAYLYVEHLRPINPYGSTLVIRAINATEATLTEFSASSLVSEFFKIAILIAQQNNIRHVCFCEPTGMHLMSNRSSIEDEVVKPHYVSRSKQGSLIHGRIEPHPSLEAPTLVKADFSAYSSGNQVVDQLYVIWQDALARSGA